MGKYKSPRGVKTLCICSLCTILLSGCGEGPVEDKTVVVDNSEKTVAFSYATVERGDVIATKRIRCTYRQQSEAEQSFQLTGKIVDKVYVQEGDYVKKGDLLATLTLNTLNRDIEDLEYKIERNELLLSYIENNEVLDIQNAWVNYLSSPWQSAEGKKAVEEQVESIQQRYRYQREDCQDGLELDRKKLASLKQEKKYCSLTAEMDGLVYEIKRNLQGSTSKEGETVITIVDNSQCLFETDYVEEDAVHFHEGDFLEMIVNIGNAAGTYILTPYQPDQWTDKMQFKVYDGPYTSGLEVGTSGMMTFTTEKKEQVLFLPKKAVNKADDKYYVYVADENGMRQVKWIEVGVFGDNLVEIVGGLEEGDKVIQR